MLELQRDLLPEEVVNHVSGMPCPTDRCVGSLVPYYSLPLTLETLKVFCPECHVGFDPASFRYVIKPLGQEGDHS